MSRAYLSGVHEKAGYGVASAKLELLDVGHVDAEVLQLIDLLEARYLLGARFLLPFLYLGGLSCFLLGRGRLLLPECIRTSKRS